MFGRAVALLGIAALAACSGGGSAAKLCATVRSDRTVAAVFSGFDPTDTEHALEQLRAARVTLGELHDDAPDEVRDDLSVEIDYVQDLIDGIKATEGRDAAEAVEVVRQVTADHDDVTEAASNLAAFSAKHCE
jgi:hypothetical protein